MTQRKDYDEDQPRAEDGKWTDGGGGSSTVVKFGYNDAGRGDTKFKAWVKDAGLNAGIANRHMISATGGSDPLERYVGAVSLNDKIRAGTLTEKHAEDVKALDGLIAQHRLKTPVQVYRGVGYGPLTTAKPGDTVEDKGYMSTSVDPDVARQFAFYGRNEGEDEDFNEPSGGSPTIVEMVVPQGTNAVVGDLFDGELLLGRGHHVEVLEVKEGSRNSARRVKVKLVTAKKDYDEDQPRDEDGKWTDGGGAAAERAAHAKPSGGWDHVPKDPEWEKHRAKIAPERDFFGEYKVGTKNWWATPKNLPRMSRDEAAAKVAELRAKAEDIRAQTRAGTWTGTGENSGWMAASRIADEEVRDVLRAGYDKDAEYVDPTFDDLDSISLPGHLYRGMEAAEFDATVALGKGVHSQNRFSARDIEGTNFGWEAGTANSYANTGDSSPLRTGKPNYIVEVKPDETITYNRTAGYPQTPVGEGLSHKQITRVWKFEGRDGKLVMKEIAVPAARKDYDEDQPRDEDGKWTDGGGGGGSGGKKDPGTFRGNIYRTSKEYSRKNLPGGKTKKEHEADWKGEDYNDERREYEKKWDREVARAVSLGKIDPETAKEAGWYESGHVDKGFEKLPPRMWHVTTAADAVRATGLKTRSELNQADGKGLGGGPDDTISFTDSPQIAADIQASMHEFHDLLNDKVTIKEMYERAASGSDAKKPYAADLLRSMDAKSIDDVLSDKVRYEHWNMGDDGPPTKEEWYDPEAPRYSGLDGSLLKDVKGSRVPVPADKWRKVEDKYSTGRDGQKAPKPFATVWERDKSDFEKDSKKAEFFKAYSMWREQAGGRMDPLFFSTDVAGFKKIPRDQIQVMEFEPTSQKDEEGNEVHPVGYRANSLGEIRTYTGEAVRLVNEQHKARKDREADITKGSLGIPREEMPQLPSGTTLENFLDRQEDRGFKVRRSEPRRVSDLKPTQSTMNMAKVESMVKNVPREILAKPVVVSEDNHILDGHHRWAALKILDPDATIQTHYVGMPIRRLLDEARNDPNSIRRTVNDSDDTMKTRLDSILEDLKARRDDLDRRIEALEITQQTLRLDFDEDQPRAEDGKWTSGGGGGGGGKSKSGTNHPPMSASSGARLHTSKREKAPEGVDADTWKRAADPAADRAEAHASKVETSKKEEPKTEYNSGNPFEETEGSKAFKETPEEAAYIKKAKETADELVKEWQEKLAPHGVRIAMGGSLTSGLALPGDVQDADIRFLFDGDRKALVPEIEKATGLKFRKSITVGDGRVDPLSDAYMIEGILEKNGVKLEVEGALRTAKGYTGWQNQYKDVLTPEELRVARARKWELAQDKTGRKAKEYKAYKNSILKEVQNRVVARQTKTKSDTSDLRDPQSDDEWRQDFDEDQPRDEGGRWTDGGGGGGGAAKINAAERGLTGSSPKNPSKEPSKGLKDLSERVGKMYRHLDEPKASRDTKLDKKGVLMSRATRLEPAQQRYMMARAEGQVARDADMEKTLATVLGVRVEDLEHVARDFKKHDIPRAVRESRRQWQGKAFGKVDTKDAFFDPKSEKWAPERVAIRTKYISDTFRAKEDYQDENGKWKTRDLNKPLPKTDEPVFHMTGGGYAAGKTTALVRNPSAGIPGKSEAAFISADDAKEYIPEYVAGKRAGDANAGTFAHEESSTISKVAVQRALKSGHNIVFDSSGDSGVDNLENKIKQYREWGAKKIVANYAVLDVEEAVRRSDKRADEEGRYVPHTLLRENHAAVAATLVGAIERKLFDKADIWDTTGDGSKEIRPPKHIATYTKEEGLKVHNQDLWDKLVQRAEAGKAADVDKARKKFLK